MGAPWKGEGGQTRAHPSSPPFKRDFKVSNKNKFRLK